MNKQRENITELVCKAYRAYFGVTLENQDKPWAPYTTCHTCVSGLRKFYYGKQGKLASGFPMVWREQVNHCDDCYFCLCKVSATIRKTRRILSIQICLQQ